MKWDSVLVCVKGKGVCVRLQVLSVTRTASSLCELSEQELRPGSTPPPSPSPQDYYLTSCALRVRVASNPRAPLRNSQGLEKSRVQYFIRGHAGFSGTSGADDELFKSALGEGCQWQLAQVGHADSLSETCPLHYAAQNHLRETQHTETGKTSTPQWRDQKNSSRFLFIYRLFLGLKSDTVIACWYCNNLLVYFWYIVTPFAIRFPDFQYKNVQV